MKINPDAFYLSLAKKQMSQRDLTKQCGVSPATLANIKKQHDVQPKTVGILSRELGVTVEFLLGLPEIIQQEGA